MKFNFKYTPITILLSFFFLSCDNPVVSRAEYDAVVDYMKDLEAENDSLQFEISDLKHYNDYLTAKLDSIQNEETNR